MTENDIIWSHEGDHIGITIPLSIDAANRANTPLRHSGVPRVIDLVESFGSMIALADVLAADEEVSEGRLPSHEALADLVVSTRTAIQRLEVLQSAAVVAHGRAGGSLRALDPSGNGNPGWAQRRAERYEVGVLVDTNQAPDVLLGPPIGWHEIQEHEDGTHTHSETEIENVSIGGKTENRVSSSTSGGAAVSSPGSLSMSQFDGHTVYRTDSARITINGESITVKPGEVVEAQGYRITATKGGLQAEKK